MLRRSTCLLFLTFSGAAFAAVDPGLLALVPPDAIALSGVDVPRALASPFGRDVYARVLGHNPSMERFGPVVGFDAKRDLRELLLVTSAHVAPYSQAANDRRPAYDLILARGTFHVDRFSSMASMAGGTATQEQGVTVIQLGQASPVRRQSVAFLDSSTAAIGSPASITALLVRRTAKTAYTGALAQKASTVSAGGDVWFASNAPLSALLSNNHARAKTLNLETAEEQITNANGSLTFDGNSVKVSTEGTAKSEAEAKTYAAALSGAVLLIKNPRFLPLKGAQISASGAALAGRLTLSSMDLEHMLFRPLPQAAKTASISSR